MAKVIRRVIGGKAYYYLEKNVKVGPRQWQKASIYLGKKKPSSKGLEEAKKKLAKKVKTVLDAFYERKLSGYRFSVLSRKLLGEAERVKDNFLARFRKLSKAGKTAYDRRQTVDFVYTTLRTEGVDVEFSDVETAFDLIDKRKNKYTFNPKVIISSAMVMGLNYLPKLEIKKQDVLRLHGIIMSSFEDKSPGRLRGDQRVIVRFNPLTAQREEIQFRPPAPAAVERELEKFFDWFAGQKNTHPLELAALVHLAVYRIHPFKNGNKRMCRLLFNKVLLDAGYPLLNVSKETGAYFKALIHSVESGDDKPFARFCAETFIRQLKHRRLKNR